MGKIKHLIADFVVKLGVLWTIAEVIFLGKPPESLFQRIIAWGILILGVFIWIFFESKIKKVVMKKVFDDTDLEIKYGDIFDEKDGHLIIGTNNVFDTELGEVIKANSIQGQFLSKCYSGDVNKLDKDINEELNEFSSTEKKENKRLGKIDAYPIGTTISLGTPDRRYFLPAYCMMDDDCKASSDYKMIWESLNKLWEKIRQKGQGYRISMGVIGSDCARTGLTRMFLIKMIIISFLSATKKEPFTKKLTIIVWKDDKEFVNLHNIKRFVDDLKIEE